MGRFFTSAHFFALARLLDSQGFVSYNAIF